MRCRQTPVSEFYRRSGSHYHLHGQRLLSGLRRSISRNFHINKNLEFCAISVDLMYIYAAEGPRKPPVRPVCVIGSFVGIAIDLPSVVLSVFSAECAFRVFQNERVFIFMNSLIIRSLYLRMCFSSEIVFCPGVRSLNSPTASTGKSR